MKIIGLKVDGFRKLSAVEMQFAEKGLTQIRGKNKQGKSTLLDVIQFLIQGKKYLKKDMIQHGQKKAEVVGQLGNWEIRRVVTANSDRLEITDMDTGLIKSKSPQAFLDTFINELTFDPLPFVQKSSNEKLLFMMGLCSIDFTQLDKDITIAENERTFAGRELKSHGVPEEKEEVKPVSISALTFDLTEGQKLINAIETHEQFLVDKANECQTIENEISVKKQQLAICKREYNEEKELILELGEKPDLAPIQEQIETAESINEKASQYKMYLTDIEEHERLYDKHNLSDNKVKDLRDAKKAKFEDAKVPIEGLEIREDGLYFKDSHSENWSDQENYEISSKLCLAMKPELQAIFIDRGELYDNDRLKELHEWGEKNGLQVIITIVDNDIGESVEGAVYYLEEGKII